MLSTRETAALLGVSPQRVRAMIAQGVLPASKVGKAWMIREEDAMARKEQGAGACRVAKPEAMPAADLKPGDADWGLASRTHELYQKGWQLAQEPLHELVGQASSKDEAAFALAIREFFLQRTQRELVERGCF